MLEILSMGKYSKYLLLLTLILNLNHETKLSKKFTKI